MREWDRLAEHASGASSLGQKAEISGLNLYIRLNSYRVMAGESMMADAPAAEVAVPNVSYSHPRLSSPPNWSCSAESSMNLLRSSSW